MIGQAKPAEIKAGRVIRLTLSANGRPGIGDKDMEGITALALGKPVEVGLGLCRTLFALCPIAHSVAFLEAVEASMGVSPSAQMAESRLLLVLAEAIASSIWRQSVQLPLEHQGVPDLVSVKAARSYVAEFSKALLPDGFSANAVASQMPGFADGGLPPAAQDLVALARSLASDRFDFLDLCPDMWVDHRCLPLPIKPDEGPYEETPLSLSGQASLPLPLKRWYKAQREHLLFLAAALSGDMELSLVPGTVMTARGRLTHRVTVDRGILTAWTIHAPTDWNFAEKGPAARALDGVDDEWVANWIVGAFDPCAPVTFVREAGHA